MARGGCYDDQACWGSTLWMYLPCSSIEELPRDVDLRKWGQRASEKTGREERTIPSALVAISRNAPSERLYRFVSDSSVPGEDQTHSRELEFSQVGQLSTT